MHFSTISFYSATAILLAHFGVATFTVNSPTSLVQCQPILIQYAGATASNSVYLSVIQGGNPSSAALESFPKQTSDNTGAGQYTWQVDLPANTMVTVKAVDSTGNIAYSGTVTIQAGSSTNCATPGATTGAAAAAAGSSPSSSPGSSSSSSSGSSSGSASSNSSSTPGSTTSSPTGSPTPNSPSPSPSSSSSSTTTKSAANSNKMTSNAFLLALAGVSMALCAQHFSLSTILG